MNPSPLIRFAARALWRSRSRLCCAPRSLACPTCKDQLAHDPEAANIARGYAYSIVFMLSMPPLILGSLCAYFYWEVRKARARQSLPA